MQEKLKNRAMARSRMAAPAENAAAAGNGASDEVIAARLRFWFADINVVETPNEGDTADISLKGTGFRVDVTEEPVLIYAYYENSNTKADKDAVAQYTSSDGETLSITFKAAIAELYENTQGVIELKGKASDIISLKLGNDPRVTLGDLEITDIETNTSSLTQEIYWVDNNTEEASGRPGEGEYLKFFKENARILVTIKSANDVEKVLEIPAGELASVLSVEEGKDVFKITDLGGTGHYQLSVNAGILPVSGKIWDTTVDPAKSSEVTLTWEYMIPEKAPEGYYYAEEDGTSDVAKGWYYLKTQDFKVELNLRRGDGGDMMTDLKDELLNAFSFYWKQNRNDSDEQSRTLKILSTTQGIGVSFVPGEAKPNGQTDTYILTIPNLPAYRVDGTQNLYYVARTNKDAADADRIPGAEIEGLDSEDYLKITYENDNVANMGDETEKAYGGGNIILTRTGETDYTGHKRWGDAGYDSAKRPDVEFHLWRYTNKPGEDYKHAAPVKNEAGNIVVMKMDGEIQANEYAIDFHNHDKLASFESVLLEEEEMLPKYDPEGYKYVYLAREYMYSNGSSDSYDRIYGMQEEDGPFIEDKERADSDTSIYDGQTIINRISGKVTVEVNKTWKAAAYQDAIQDVKVVMTLQSRVKEENTEPEAGWKNVIRNGKEVTVALEGFTAEQLTKTEKVTVDKYNYQGKELEYRWVESAVYQGKDSTNDLLQDDMSFFLNHSGGDVRYVSETDKTLDKPEGGCSTSITNRIKDEVDYVVVKKWVDGNGNPAEPPKGAEVTVQLYRQGRNMKFEEIEADPFLVMDGKKDDKTQTFQVDIGDTDNLVEVKWSESDEWKLIVEGLPKYDIDGYAYTYIAMEVESDNRYDPSYTNEIKDNTYYTTITNGPGPGLEIYVRKQWMDDGDSQHRGEVKFAVYERTAEETFELIRDDIVISAQNFWWKEVGIHNGVEEKNLIVIETAVQNGDNDKWVEIWDGMTEDEKNEKMEEIYQIQQESGVEDENNLLRFSTDQHDYLQRHSTEEIAGNKFFTVTNQRLGFIDLTVKKSWRDGDGKTREELTALLESNQHHLAIRLTCDLESAIKYEEDKVDIGDGAYPVMKPKTSDENSELERTSAIQQINMGEPSSTYYFYELPKYTKEGAIVHYSVEEVVVNENNVVVGTFADYFRDDKSTIYTSTIKAGDYNTGERHTHDKQLFEIYNKVTGTKNIEYRKIWQDEFRYIAGERPDLSLDIYQLLHDKDTKEEKLVSIYKDYKWVKIDTDKNHDWKITLENLPKYDEWGYEILYYAKENVNIDREAFDYAMPVYYYVIPADGDGTVGAKEKTGTETESGSIEIPGTKVGSEDGGPEDGYERDKYLRKLEDTTWLLQEGGIFVNQIKEDVFFEGKKIWQLIPSGFATADLPQVKFALHKISYDEDNEPIVEAEEYAHVTIRNWDQMKLSDGSFPFELRYKGENINSVVDGKLEVTPANESASELIPQYSEDGELYEYVIVETITFDNDKVTAN